MPTELRWRGVQTWPRRSTIVAALHDAKANGEDPAEALIEAYTNGQELLDEYNALRDELFSAYQTRRKLNGQKESAASRMRQARKNTANPHHADRRYEEAEQAWDEADEKLRQLSDRIEELEESLRDTAQRYEARYFEVEDAGAISLPSPERIEQEAT